MAQFNLHLFSLGLLYLIYLCKSFEMIHLELFFVLFSRKFYGSVKKLCDSVKKLCFQSENYVLSRKTLFSVKKLCSLIVEFFTTKKLCGSVKNYAIQSDGCMLK